MNGAGAGYRPAPWAVLSLVAWTALLAVSVVLIHRVGGPLAPPPLTDPSHLGHWLEQRQPAEAAFAVVRLLALVLAWYLLVVTVAGALARADGAGALVRAADAVSLPLVRRLVHGAVGVSFAAATITGAGASARADDRPGPSVARTTAETMRRLPDLPPDDETPASSTTSVLSRPPGTIGSPTMRRLPDLAPAGETGAPTTISVPAGGAGAPTTAAVPSGRAADRTTTTAGADNANATTTTTVVSAAGASEGTAGSIAASAPGPAGGQAPPAARIWRVQPGDHLWAVAERVLAEAWKRSPADAEVDPYWRALVDANAAVLRDPGNPDLLFPGQVVDIPEPPSPPAPPG